MSANEKNIYFDTQRIIFATVIHTESIKEISEKA